MMEKKRTYIASLKVVSGSRCSGFSYSCIFLWRICTDKNIY